MLYPKDGGQAVCFNQFLITPRQIPLQLVLKRTKQLGGPTRRFEKDKSVFKDWREDTAGLVERSLALDLKLSKLGRLVKD